MHNPLRPPPGTTSIKDGMDLESGGDVGTWLWGRTKLTSRIYANNVSN